MGLLDKFKSKAGEHGDKVNQGLDKAGEAVSNKTGGKYDDKIDSAKDKISGQLGTDDTGATDQGEQGGEGEQGGQEGGDRNP